MASSIHISVLIREIIFIVGQKHGYYQKLIVVEPLVCICDTILKTFWLFIRGNYKMFLFLFFTSPSASSVCMFETSPFHQTVEPLLFDQIHDLRFDLFSQFPGKKYKTGLSVKQIKV